MTQRRNPIFSRAWLQVLLMTAGSILPGTIHSTEKPKWRKCEKNKECVIIPTYCRGFASVNSASIVEARMHFDRLGAVKECSQKYAPVPEPGCRKGSCMPEVVVPAESTPPRSAVDWAVRALIQKSYNKPFRDPERSIPAALEIVHAFPSTATSEKRVQSKSGRVSTDATHRFPALCLDVHYVSGEFASASKVMGCSRSEGAR